ncbi:MAG: phage major tail protein, TP901-1 family [Cetobacterium sp.]
MASGVNFLIFVDKSTNETPNFVKVGGQRGGKFNRSGDTIDVTTKDDIGWKNNRAGLLEWSIEGDGVMIENDEGFKLLEQKFLAREQVKVKIGYASGLAYEGMGVLTDFPLDAPYDDEVTYSIKIQGCGAVTPKGQA